MQRIEANTGRLFSVYNLVYSSIGSVTVITACVGLLPKKDATQLFRAIFLSMGQLVFI